MILYSKTKFKVFSIYNVCYLDCCDLKIKSSK